MIQFKPFAALRPKKEKADRVCCPPYDVIDTARAAQIASGNDDSFVHVIRSEIDLAENKDVYSNEVYEKAAENLEKMEKSGLLVQDKKPCYYIYRQLQGGREQNGICALAGIDDYAQGKIKKHELTLPAKEEDRLNHFLACRAHTEPVFLFYKKNDAIGALIKKLKDKYSPVYDFTDEAATTHTLWVVSDDDDIQELMGMLEEQECLYIADGHHRSASSVRAGMYMRGKYPDYEPDAQFNYIMAVAFPENELNVMDYNRLLKDTGEYTAEVFAERLKADFIVEKLEKMQRASEPHTFMMYINGAWYRLTAKSGSFDEKDSIASLDASILQNNVFDKILGITDPRTSPRLSFVGGINGYKALSDKVDDNSYSAAFALFPVTTQQLRKVADENKVMPPKSTWFEPKLASGLFIHKF